MKKLKLFLLCAFLCVGSFAVNSCGDDDEDDAKSSTPSTNDSNVTPNPGGDTNNDKPAPVETKTFTVTFNTDGGSEVAAQTVEDGKSATKPDDPTKERFNFEGWFNGESLYDFASPVTSDLTLTAQWKIKTFTVTFNTDGGSEVAAQTVEVGKTATKPDVPTKEGFYFLGWYEGENVYEFTQPVSNDLTVTAKWMEKTEYDVDLGLPSGTLWATCNVGAQNPWDYGDYFAWGETEPKDDYSWSPYKYCNGSSSTMTKYCNKSDYGYNGFTDELTVLQPVDDAATVNMGSNWRMPTEAEVQELYDNCDWEWTSNYNGTGVSGYIVKSRITSTSLFLPAAGYRGGAVLGAGSRGYYWSSSLDSDGPSGGRNLYFASGGVYPDGWYGRRYGQSVRPVRCR